MTKRTPFNPEDDPFGGPGAPCGAAADIPAYVQGELDAEASERMEAHLLGCSLCAAEAADLQQLLAGLHLIAPDTPPVHDLQATLMSQVRQRAIAPFRAIGPTATTLLGMLVAVTLINAILKENPAPSTWSPPPTLASAGLPSAWPAQGEAEVWTDRSWLLEAQSADGSWSPETFGGRAQWRVAMTGLALVALSTDDEAAQLRPVTEAIDRGVSFLRRRQDGEGLFGKPEASMNFNHILATWGLRAVYDRYPHTDIRIALTRARYSELEDTLSNLLQPAQGHSNSHTLLLSPDSWGREGGEILRVCARLIERNSALPR